MFSVTACTFRALWLHRPDASRSVSATARTVLRYASRHFAKRTSQRSQEIDWLLEKPRVLDNGSPPFAPTERIHGES